MADGRDLASDDVVTPDDPLVPDPPADPRERNGVDVSDRRLATLRSRIDAAVRRRDDQIPRDGGDFYLYDLQRVDDGSVVASCGVTADLGKPIGYWVFVCLVDADGEGWSVMELELVNKGFHA